MTVNTFYRLLRRLTDTITIPFHGEPLSGLQIMGVLETRALDFDRIIILSVNEGIYPTRKGANSFIPYNLRKGFGLPTYEHQDSVWAYHFYRLIYRSKQVSLLYDTRATVSKPAK
jgi:Inactivated superfamily I helicase